MMCKGDGMKRWGAGGGEVLVLYVLVCEFAEVA